MHIYRQAFLLAMVSFLRLVKVNLADGGTSLPLKVAPLPQDYQDDLLSDALPFHAPSKSSQVEIERPMEDSGGRGDGGQNGDNGDVNNSAVNEDGKIPTTGSGVINVTRPNTTSVPRPTTRPGSISSAAAATTHVLTTTQEQHHNSKEPTSSPPPPIHACHTACLRALNSTRLTPIDTLALSAGSSLVLECQLPLVPDLILEDMAWLFHPGGTPEGRCSLTRHKYLPSCPGFPALSETDYRNDTFLMQTLTLSDLGTNHTGDYMCQVQVTCCPGYQQHLMSQQNEVQVSVRVWWTDYTLELASTGVAAMLLLLALLGLSVYNWRRGINKDYYDVSVVDAEALPIVHLPLIDNQDADSFDSSSHSD